MLDHCHRWWANTEPSLAQWMVLDYSNSSLSRPPLYVEKATPPSHQLLYKIHISAIYLYCSILCFQRIHVLFLYTFHCYFPTFCYIFLKFITFRLLSWKHNSKEYYLYIIIPYIMPLWPLFLVSVLSYICYFLHVYRSNTFRDYPISWQQRFQSLCRYINIYIYIFIYLFCIFMDK